VLSRRSEFVSDAKRAVCKCFVRQRKECTATRIDHWRPWPRFTETNSVWLVLWMWHKFVAQPRCA